MKRRQILAASSAIAVAGSLPSASAIGPLAILRFILGLGVRGTATAGARAMASRAVTMSVSRAGVTRTVQVVTTKELGISVAGVVAFSIPAAEAMANYDCRSVCIEGVHEFGKLTSSIALTIPTHVTLNIFNGVTRKFEDYRREYANSGAFEFTFKLPWEPETSVKQFDGRADDDPRIAPFTTGNVLLVRNADVIYEAKR